VNDQDFDGVLDYRPQILVNVLSCRPEKRASREDRHVGYWIWPRWAGQPKRKSGSSELDFDSRPFHTLMRSMKAKGDKEMVHRPGERLLDVG
jgi:hypothetical protein